MNIQQLVLRLSELRLNGRAYCIGPKWSALSDVFVLDKIVNGYEFFHVTRGEKTVLSTFSSEEEACDYVLGFLSKDATLRVHNVGLFFGTEQKAKALIELLSNANISSKIAEIKHGGSEGTHYRVFIIGNDLDKVRTLRQ